MSSPANIFLAPCANDRAFDYLQETVVDGVNEDRYRDYVDLPFAGDLPIWGAGPHAENQISEWERDDFILFYTGDHAYTYAARIRAVERNPELSAALWPEYNAPSRESTEEGWPYVIYLRDVREVEIDSVDLHERAGYAMKHVQQFMRMNDPGPERIATKFGSVRSFIEQHALDSTDDEVVDAEIELEQRVRETPELKEPTLESADEEYVETRRRARSGAFAKRVKELYDRHCAICEAKRKSPTGTFEVEAAHIYPKSANGRDDVRNGLALCTLHHWAFDSGWLGLTDDRHVLVKDRPDLPGYDDFEPLADDRIRLPAEPDYRPARLYIREHRALNGFSTA